MNKLSPKIKIGCSKCGTQIILDNIDFNFNLTEQPNKVKTIFKNKTSKKSSKVVSLF